jgi:serine O-acetyltransferase
MFEHLREDYRRYQRMHATSGLRGLLEIATTYGFIAVAVYRYGRWTRTIEPRLLSLPFKLVYRVMNVFVELVFGISVSTNGAIGPGFYIGHFGAIFLHCDAGRNLSIGQDTTIGYKGAGKSTGFPKLGDDVYVGTGARILGDIRVGDGSLIGANTVVTKDVPPRTRVVGAAVRMTPLDGPPEPAKRFEDGV